MVTICALGYSKDEEHNQYNTSIEGATNEVNHTGIHTLTFRLYY